MNSSGYRNIVQHVKACTGQEIFFEESVNFLAHPSNK